MGDTELELDLKGTLLLFREKREKNGWKVYVAEIELKCLIYKQGSNSMREERWEEKKRSDQLVNWNFPISCGIVGVSQQALKSLRIIIDVLFGCCDIEILPICVKYNIINTNSNESFAYTPRSDCVRLTIFEIFASSIYRYFFFSLAWRCSLFSRILPSLATLYSHSFSSTVAEIEFMNFPLLFLCNSFPPFHTI